MSPLFLGELRMFQRFRAEADHRERRAQLVRDVGDERSAKLHRLRFLADASQRERGPHARQQQRDERHPEAHRALVLPSATAGVFGSHTRANAVSLERRRER
jgi:hypothetical protein